MLQHAPVALITEKLRGQTLDDDLKVSVSKTLLHYNLIVPEFLQISLISSDAYRYVVCLS